MDVGDSEAILGPSVVTHVGHLAAAVYRAENPGIVRDFHLGGSHQGEQQGRSRIMACDVDAVHATHAAAKDVAHGLGLIGEAVHLIRIADDAARNLDDGLAFVVVGGISLERIAGMDDASLTHAGDGQTTAAVDGAVDLATAHFDGGVAAYITGGVVLATVVTATAEDVAVVAGGTVGTHQTAHIVDFSITKHVAVLSAAERATPNTVGGGVVVGHPDGDVGVVDVGDSEVLSRRMSIGEVDRIVSDTLTATEHITVGTSQGDRDVVAGASLRSRAHLTAIDIHRGETSVGHRIPVFVHLTYATHLTAAVHVVEDVTAIDVDGGVAADTGDIDVAV